MSSSNTIEKVIRFLEGETGEVRSRRSEKPWFTVRTLADRVLNRKQSEKQLERILLDYYSGSVEQNTIPSLRYSSLPSKSSLEVLWGATQHVGDRQLDPLLNTNIAVRIPELLETDTEDKSSIFLSHSHRDFEMARDLSIALREDRRPWLAEMMIEKQRPINGEIISALRQANECLVLVTRASLQSTWTGKEAWCFEQFAAQNSGTEAKETYYVLNVDDTEVREVKEYLQGTREEIPPRCQTIWHDVFSRLRERLNQAQVYECTANTASKLRFSDNFQLRRSAP